MTNWQDDFFHLFNWFQLFTYGIVFLKIAGQSEQVKNGPFERGFRWFYVFHWFYFLTRIIPEFVKVVDLFPQAQNYQRRFADVLIDAHLNLPQTGSFNSQFVVSLQAFLLIYESGTADLDEKSMKVTMHINNS